MITNLNKYKNKKIVLDDLLTIQKIINLAIKSLEFFPYYKISQRILTTLKEEKIMIKAEIEKCKDVNEKR